MLSSLFCEIQTKFDDMCNSDHLNTKKCRPSLLYVVVANLYAKKE